MDEDIQKALTQFEVKALEEKPVQNKNLEPNFSKPSKLVEWVISHSGGMIKNDRHAEYVLLAFIGIIIVITVIIFTSDGPSTNDFELEPIPDQSQFTQ